MWIIEVIIFFLLPSNVLLLVFLKYENKWHNFLEKEVMLAFSYGIAPLVSSLIFYYLIWFFPNKNNLFYVFILLLFWTFILVYFWKNNHKLLLFYKDFIKELRDKFNVKIFLLIFPLILFVIVYLFQIFGFPMVDGDSANYINQGKALYEAKNLNYENKVTTIGGNDDYIYNVMIRPGIPSLLALSFSLVNNSGDYFVYNFLMAFYHILLLLFFLFLVKELAIKLEKPIMPALFFGSVFFILSWTLTRIFIFGNKEPIIYFLTLIGIYLMYKLVNSGKRNLMMEGMLGVTIGLNTLINIHGIIIGIILFLLLAMFSKLSFVERAKQITFIFILHLFFGAFEFLLNFKWIFSPIIKTITEKFNIKMDIFSVFNKFNSKKMDPEIARIISGRSNIVKVHEDLYQINNFKEIYLKGKLQILTNIGAFGFNFWLFLLVILKKTREIISSKLGKVIIFFILLYVLVVIDPFGMNRHPLAIVLWGSPKYASLVLLASMIITSIYAWPFINKLFSFINKENKKIFPAMITVLIITLFFKNSLVNFGLKVLTLTVPFYKDIAFYKGKISVFLSCLILSLIIYSIVFVLIKAEKLKMAKNLFVLNLIFIFILAPFLITNVGKVPLEKTFSYIGKSQRDKLINILNYGNTYDVYFYAKEHLPKNSFIVTSLDELYIYDDYFQLTRKILNTSHYEISKDCKENIIYSKEGFNLCKIN